MIHHLFLAFNDAIYDGLHILRLHHVNHKHDGCFSCYHNSSSNTSMLSIFLPSFHNIQPVHTCNRCTVDHPSNRPDSPDRPRHTVLGPSSLHDKCTWGQPHQPGDPRDDPRVPRGRFAPVLKLQPTGPLPGSLPTNVCMRTHNIPCLQGPLALPRCYMQQW